jgi:acetyl esterase/lipase
MRLVPLLDGFLAKLSGFRGPREIRLIVACVSIFIAGVIYAGCTSNALAADAPVSDPAPPPRVELWPEGATTPGAADDFRPYLELYLLTETDAADAPSTHGAVIVFPGGGYSHRSAHEGEPVARRFNEAGLSAFVLQYRVKPNRHPAPLLDARRAVRLVRSRAAEWGIDPGKIAICGFSAGGHLAASAGVHCDLPIAGDHDSLMAFSARPDALILSYPVIASGPFRHKGSFNLLLGEPNPPESMALMSLEDQVTTATPPAFLWHTSDDQAVPVENSLLFARALADHDVPFELHVYPHGRHGLNLALGDPHVATWSDLCVQWLESMGWKKGMD